MGAVAKTPSPRVAVVAIFTLSNLRLDLLLKGGMGSVERSSFVMLHASFVFLLELFQPTIERAFCDPQNLSRLFAVTSS